MTLQTVFLYIYFLVRVSSSRKKSEGTTPFFVLYAALTFLSHFQEQSAPSVVFFSAKENLFLSCICYFYQAAKFL